MCLKYKHQAGWEAYMSFYLYRSSSYHIINMNHLCSWKKKGIFYPFKRQKMENEQITLAHNFQFICRLHFSLCKVINNSVITSLKFSDFHLFFTYLIIEICSPKLKLFESMSSSTCVIKTHSKSWTYGNLCSCM